MLAANRPTRIPFTKQVELHVADGRATIPGALDNVSLNGALIRTQEALLDLPLGSKGTLRLIYPDGRTLDVACEVARLHECEIGLRLADSRVGIEGALARSPFTTPMEN